MSDEKRQNPFAEMRQGRVRQSQIAKAVTSGEWLEKTKPRAKCGQPSTFTINTAGA